MPFGVAHLALCLLLKVLEAGAEAHWIIWRIPQGLVPLRQAGKLLLEPLSQLFQRWPKYGGSARESNPLLDAQAPRQRI